MTGVTTSAIDRRDALDATNRSRGHTAVPAIGVRIALALAVGLLAGWYAYWHRVTFDPPSIIAYDVTWPWRAAQALLQHQNPYEVIRPTGPFPFDSGFKYPLPFAVLALPIAGLSPAMALAVFGGAGAALFTFALTRDGYWRLPLLGSAPVLSTLSLGQTGFWTVSAALLPSIAWLGFCVKPTAALCAFAYRPSWRAIVGALAFGVACLLLVPGWPLDWLRAMFSDPMTHWYVPGVMIANGAGAILLLAALRWRTAEARVLLAMAIVPQVQALQSGLVVMLCARTFREAAILAVCSLLGYIAWLKSVTGFPPVRVIDPAHQGPWLLLTIYLPALVLVLRRTKVE